MKTVNLKVRFTSLSHSTLLCLLSILFVAVWSYVFVMLIWVCALTDLFCTFNTLLGHISFPSPEYTQSLTHTFEALSSMIALVSLLSMLMLAHGVFTSHQCQSVWGV